MTDTVAGATVAELQAELVSLKQQLDEANGLARRAADRGEIENLFSRYMYLHNAFQDEGIIPLWVGPGTPGIRAQDANPGVCTTWESVPRYHRRRPAPAGKLIRNAETTPVIDVAGDGETARG